MSTEGLILAALLLAVIGLLIVLLLRRAPVDAGLQAGQERLGQTLAAMQESVKADLARQGVEASREMSGFTLEQTKLLGEAMLSQTKSLAGAEKALLDRLAADAKSAQETAAEQTRALAAAMLKQTQALAEMEKALLERLAADAKATQEAMNAETTRSRDVLDKKLAEMRENSEKSLAEIQKSVNEQLAEAVEKKMTESFSRVIDQFAALQKAMGDVQAVTTQIGDIKRLFGNVKTRGGWGETQVRSMLDDILPPNSYQQNVKLVEGSADAVEFCVVMPSSGETQVLLPIDSKFPTEDFERLQAAWEAADPVAEAQARRGLEVAIRTQSKKIAEKYINPPRTTEFAVLYLPTEGLYAEVARIPGLIDGIGREHRIVVLGPTLLPAMLRTIQLGHVTLALSKNAEGVKDLLGATKAEIGKMDALFASLAKQVGTVGSTIGKVQQRTRIIAGKLRGVDSLPGEEATALLGLEDGTIEGDED